MPGRHTTLRDRRTKWARASQNGKAVLVPSRLVRSRRHSANLSRPARTRKGKRRRGALPWLRSASPKKPVRKCVSQADFDHLLMSPHDVINPDIATPTIVQGVKTPLDIDIYLASPAKVKAR